MSDKFKIPHWNDYQHYKDRCPPWIKLHVKLLNDRKFTSLAQASRGLLMQLWVLASENEGCVMADLTELRFRLRDDSIKSEDVNILIEKGFLKICKQSLADASALQADASRCSPETETEGEFSLIKYNPISEKKDKKRKSFEYTDDFNSFWQIYPRQSGKGKAFEEWQRTGRNGRPTLEEILQAVEHQKGSHEWTKDGGQFVPLPATWLHQRRWDDVPTPTDPFKGKISERTARTLANMDRWEAAQDGEQKEIS